jgi:hypothetical protein
MEDFVTALPGQVAACKQELELLEGRLTKASKSALLITLDRKELSEKRKAAETELQDLLRDIADLDLQHSELLALDSWDKARPSRTSKDVKVCIADASQCGSLLNKGSMVPPRNRVLQLGIAPQKAGVKCCSHANLFVTKGDSKPRTSLQNAIPSAQQFQLQSKRRRGLSWRQQPLLRKETCKKLTVH